MGCEKWIGTHVLGKPAVRSFEKPLTEDELRSELEEFIHRHNKKGHVQESWLKWPFRKIVKHCVKKYGCAPDGWAERLQWQEQKDQAQLAQKMQRVKAERAELVTKLAAEAAAAPKDAAFEQAVQNAVDAGATATLIGLELPGVDKWLGGEQGGDGCIYGVPGSAKSVVRVDPRTDEVTVVGSSVKGTPCSQRCGAFKWLRGALDPVGGGMYGIPSNADHVFKVRVSSFLICALVRVLIQPAAVHCWYEF